MEFTTRLEPSFEMMVLLPRKDDSDTFVFQDIGNLIFYGRLETNLIGFSRFDGSKHSSRDHKYRIRF